MKNGTFVIGNILDVESRPWNNDPNRYNHDIIIADPYTDNYGQPQTNITRVSIPDNDANELLRIKKEAMQLKGKQVMIPVIMQARAGGRNGAFLSVRIPHGSTIIICPESLRDIKAA